MDCPGLLSMVEYCVNFVVGYSFSVACGLWFTYRLIKTFVQNPCKRFWAVKNREVPPPCVNDPALGNHVYVQLKDVKLHYVEAGDRLRPLMLFLHGFPEFWYSWRHQLREFSSDYWVVAVDMRGYGESDKPIGRKNFKMEHLVADIKNLITVLGKERCTLVAHDWGGIIAWALVLKEPQLFNSYIIMNSIHPVVFYEYIKKNLSQLKKSWYVYFFQLPWLPELFCRMDDLKILEVMFREPTNKSPSPISDEDIEAYKFYFGKPGAFTAPINYYRANFLLSVAEELGGLGQDPDFPSGLIVFGERDLYINKEIQEETIQIVANTTLIYIKDANHFVQQDDPVSVNLEMRKFLSNLKPQPQE